MIVEIQNKIVLAQQKSHQIRKKFKIKGGSYKRRMKEFVAQGRCFGFDLFFIL